MSQITRDLIGAVTVTALLLSGASARADWWSRNVAPVGHAVETATHQTGAAVETATHQTGKALEIAGHDTGVAINKANNDFHAQTRRDWDHINQAADEVAKAFCSIMTGGASDNGEASCGVSGGVGVSADGKTAKPYTYDPKYPDQHYPVGKQELTIPNSSELAAMDKLFGKAPEMQDWERRESARLQLFLNPGDQIGLPWANAASETQFPNGTGEIRKPGGNFLDRRHDERYPGGYRLHGGIDYVNKVGDKVFAPVSGTVTRVIFPGEPGLTGIEIKTDRGYTAQVFYIAPPPEVTAALGHHEHPWIKAGGIIGTAQDLHMAVDDHGTSRPAYPLDVTQHVHVTLKDSDGRFVSPDGRTVIVMRKGEAPIVESKQGK